MIKQYKNFDSWINNWLLKKMIIESGRFEKSINHEKSWVYRTKIAILGYESWKKLRWVDEKRCDKNGYKVRKSWNV